MCVCVCVCEGGGGGGPNRGTGLRYSYVPSFGNGASASPCVRQDIPQKQKWYVCVFLLQL